MTIDRPIKSADDCMIDIHSVNHVVSPGGEPLQILQDVSLQIVRGESAAIVGKSGSGKTTLLGLMAGLDVPTSGAIYLDGEQINTLSEDERAKLRADRVGFVFQSFQLLPSLTALENVLLPLELAGIDYAKQQAMELLEQVGLGNRLQHTPRQLSGGEQQRVAIARAFAVTPRVLFADEPTGNLDTQTGAQITDLLMTLNQQQGTTLVMVTHDDQLAERCDKQFQIDAGRVKTS
ncbi:ABC transporter ATP-binding protein [Methylophaga sp. OBS3]|uniref:ABC transporter ATP-binding protein n=1 Tax=Methylophaga sp. OBS3 TaxID=2991934 RepID=UPI002250A241|nr:ABC transporter ATP-binding protein [Methylophaga sp. OBS3]